MDNSLHWPATSLKMVSQFGEWLSGLNIGERPMMFPFVVLFRDVRILAENHLSKLKGLVCGTMFGSAAALPFLYPQDLKGLCLLNFGLFAGSAILFAVLHSAEIALYGHYPLIGSIVIATPILVFQRNSLEAFGSYIPVLVALSLLTAVHVVPWILTYFHQRNGITLREYIMATSGNYPAASYHAVVDSGSIRSSEEFLGNLDRVWSRDPLELGHMHLNGDYPGTARPDSPPTSSLDLETGLHQQAQPEAVPMHPFL